jgi:hypothetical protein
MSEVASTIGMQIPGDTLEERNGDNASARERLDGWKEIASYLRRTSRTVQRWERSKGLPVLRHQHTKRATVYAYRHEIDRWRLEERAVAAEARRGHSLLAVSGPDADVPTRRTGGYFLLASLGGLRCG